MANSFLVIIPTCTFSGHFGGTSVHFGRAMVCILRRRYQTKIPMARTNKSDMPLKRTKNGTIRYLPYPSFGQVTMISNWLIIFVRYSNHWYVEVNHPYTHFPKLGGEKKALTLCRILIKAEKSQWGPVFSWAYFFHWVPSISLKSMHSENGEIKYINFKNLPRCITLP